MVSMGDHGTLIDSKKCEKIVNERQEMVRYSNSALPCSVSYTVTPRFRAFRLWSLMSRLDRQLLKTHRWSDSISTSLSIPSLKCSSLLNYLINFPCVGRLDCDAAVMLFFAIITRSQAIVV